jgi:hypothetical protein
VGQPGSAILSRVGVFQNWEANYYNDLHEAELVNQDRILRNYIYTFLVVGDVDIKNPWQSTFWEKDKVEPIFPVFEKFNPYIKNTYYREFSHLDFFKKRDTYQIARRSFKNVYSFKLWIFRYNNWIVIAWLYYKPLSNRQQAARASNAAAVLKIFNLYATRKQETNFLRLKLLLLFAIKSSLTVRPALAVGDRAHCLLF